MNILLDKSYYELVVKNSRFIAEVFPVCSQEEARNKLREVKDAYKDATHVVHAFIVGLQGEVCGMSDDGEPSGTAGRPVLDVLKGSGITNILLTVTRYFGGTLLGTGGLVHAYGDSAKKVLAVCKSEPYVEKKSVFFVAEYSLYEAIKRHYANYNLSNIKESYADSVEVNASIWASEVEQFCNEIKNLSKGKVEVKIQPCI